jgi:transglutaminase-like putative cysteine protease
MIAPDVSMSRLAQDGQSRVAHYAIQHVTRFEYDSPIRESVMEVRARPLDDARQSCVSFEVRTYPRAHVRTYRDSFGNVVHHFDIPGTHQREMIVSNAVVRLPVQPPLPEQLDASAWLAIEPLLDDGEIWEMTRRSRFTESDDLLETFAQEIDAQRREDPLSTCRHIAEQIRTKLAYRPQATQVDSPIDEALEARAGVCQDFAHIMLALCRRIGLPARYVSGYLAPGHGAPAAASEATHAWVEAMLPGLGWTGFDPTNRMNVGEGHIRVAVGRDYADVPPTRGVYRGESAGTIGVSVKVTPLAEAPSPMRAYPTTGWTPPEPPPSTILAAEDPRPFDLRAQQMQQQQE